MWAEIVQGLGGYESAVLTGRDAAGYPLSVRCAPRPDVATETLRVALPAGFAPEPGPAGLLCHGHNEQLWDLRSFALRGTLARDEAGWVFRPTQIIGAPANSPVALVRAVFGLRRSAREYLAKRGLPQPPIPWKELKAAKREAQAEARRDGRWM